MFLLSIHRGVGVWCGESFGFLLFVRLVESDEVKALHQAIPLIALCSPFGSMLPGIQRCLGYDVIPGVVASHDRAVR